MAEREVEQRADLPAAQPGLDRVDLVPALALLERQDVGQAFAPGRPRGSPDVVARPEAWLPLVVDQLVAQSARNPQARALLESAHESIEVVRLEAGVRGELDDALGQLAQPGEACGEGAHDRPAALAGLLPARKRPH